MNLEYDIISIKNDFMQSRKSKTYIYLVQCSCTNFVYNTKPTFNRKTLIVLQKHA